MKGRDVWFFLAGVIACIVSGWVGSMLTEPEPMDAPDTVWQWANRYVPMPAETIRVAVPAEVDTEYVIQEYFTQKIFHDTIFNNDTLKLIVNDTVWQNRIADRQVSLTFNAGRFVKDRSVSVLSSFGPRQADAMVVYRHKRWQLMAGWNFAERGPVAGIGYTLKEW